MKRIFSLLLLVLATGQTPVAPPVGVAPPIPMGARTTATASQSNHGITVNGSSTQTVPAEDAQIQLQIMSADNRLSLTKDSLSPIGDALVRAGADPSSVTYPINFDAPGASNMAQVTATVHRPSVAMLKSGVVTVGAAVAGLKDVRLTGASVTLRSSHCESALETARAAAVEVARKKASNLARELQVKLGGVANVVSNDGSQEGHCMTQYWVGPNGPQFNLSQGEPTDENYVMIPVYSYVTITYSIK